MVVARMLTCWGPLRMEFSEHSLMFHMCPEDSVVKVYHAKLTTYTGIFLILSHLLIFLTVFLISFSPAKDIRDLISPKPERHAPPLPDCKMLLNKFSACLMLVSPEVLFSGYVKNLSLTWTELFFFLELYLLPVYHCWWQTYILRPKAVWSHLWKLRMSNCICIDRKWPDCAAVPFIPFPNSFTFCCIFILFHPFRNMSKFT